MGLYSRFIRFGVFFLFAAFLLCSCSFKGVKRTKGVVYLKANIASGKAQQALNVFAPRSQKKTHPVMVFFYGGNWTSGKKSLYSFLGNRFARKNVVTVIVDYPKSPDARYDEMAADAAKSVKWVKDHIAAYGGDPDRIYVSGHSAGGHLAALISTDNKYFDQLKIENPVRGTILIDAAGLDMGWYMKEVDYGPENSYLKIFGSTLEMWKEASPIDHISKGIPPMLILRGGRTYPALSSGTDHFIEALEKQGIQPKVILQKNKKHVPMITQFFNVYNPRYKDIINFMK